MLGAAHWAQVTAVTREDVGILVLTHAATTIRYQVQACIIGAPVHWTWDIILEMLEQYPTMTMTTLRPRYHVLFHGDSSLYSVQVLRHSFPCSVALWAFLRGV